MLSNLQLYKFSNLVNENDTECDSDTWNRDVDNCCNLILCQS